MSIDFSLNSVPDGILDPSSNEPMMDSKDSTESKIELYSERWWQEVADASINRCAAHKRNGNQCRHAAMNGAAVCQTHGGRAPQVRRKAKIRIEEASDRLAKYLLEMAADKTIPEGVRLTAIRDALDRGGLGVKQAMEIEVTAKPFERVFEKVMTGPRFANPADDPSADEDDPGSLKARLAIRASRNEYSDIED